jgi:hypothetical protein
MRLRVYGANGETSAIGIGIGIGQSPKLGSLDIVFQAKLVRIIERRRDDTTTRVHETFDGGLDQTEEGSFLI